MSRFHAGLSLAAALWAALAVGVFRQIRTIYERNKVYTNRLLAAWYTLWAAHHLAVLWAARYGIWPLRIQRALALAGGGALAFAGAAVLLAGMTAFGSYARNAGKDTSALVTTGPYRWSRNPQFIGWISVLLGIALAGRSGLGLALTALMALLLHGYTVRLAEPYLERLHGEAYRRYKARTPRWIGKPAPGPRRPSKK